MLNTRDHIMGTLYGQAIGDAMGMPTELWPRVTIRTHFPAGIQDFTAGPAANPVARYYQLGEYTDDTSQALAILDGLIETHGVVDQAILVQHVLAWADAAQAWDRNILGPSSKAALLAVKTRQDPRPVTDQALTNGAGMRIAPVGTLFVPEQLEQLVQMVTRITGITHSSDVAFGGACLIAGAVTAGIADYDWDMMMTYALRANDAGTRLGAPTWAAKLRDRCELSLEIARRYRYDPRRFSQKIYELVGTGTMLSESLPAALAVAYYTRNVRDCALMCANLGGDTDTIGAMATAICGAKNGLSTIDPNWIAIIDKQNPGHDLSAYGRAIVTLKQN